MNNFNLERCNGIFHLLWCKIRVLLIELLERLRSLRLKRSFPSKTLEDNGPDAPQIRLRIILQRHYDFGRHVHGRATERGSHDSLIQKARKAKVRDLENDISRSGIWFITAMAKENVLWLQVSVNDSLRIQSLHGASNLPEEEPNGVLAERAFAVQVVSQVAAVAILHDEKDMILRFFTVKESDDVLVLQLR